MTEPTSFSDASERLEYYRCLRKSGPELNNKLVEAIPKIAIQECGKKLGIYRRGGLIVESQDELTVLFDYILYQFRRGDKNVIQRFAEQNLPSEPAEKALLEAMIPAHYSLLRVEETHPGYGVDILDLLTGNRSNLLDVSLGNSAELGMVFGGHILQVADFVMTSGAFLPMPDEILASHIEPIIRKFLPRGGRWGAYPLSRGQEAAFAAQVIRAALFSGAANTMHYRDIE